MDKHVYQPRSREIMHLVASVCPFEAEMTITSLRCLSVSVNLGAYADNLSDAVDRLLIFL